MAAVGLNEDHNDKLLKQIEYYFGDVNLPQDKFFQDEMKKDQGWISVDKLLTCKRIKKLKSDKDAIAAALKNSTICEISADGTKIRRNPAIPVPEYNHEFLKNLHDRTVYIVKWISF
uniref:HTH La-type RNA-binding domain-containing protein n=1 Tax=Panagrolaimus superbus TaxID=310955 RepID=A0A914Z3Z0_9BILA